jgi:hypothetical protein
LDWASGGEKTAIKPNSGLIFAGIYFLDRYQNGKSSSGLPFLFLESFAVFYKPGKNAVIKDAKKGCITSE